MEAVKLSLTEPDMKVVKSSVCSVVVKVSVGIYNSRNLSEVFKL